jgi:dTDP-L-rhamnose 4-epimerase
MIQPSSPQAYSGVAHSPLGLEARQDSIDQVGTSQVHRVLVTGGAGFIGSNLVKRLVSEGHHVTVFDNLLEQIHGKNPQSDSFLYRNVADTARIVRGNVTSRRALADVLPDHDVVVHFAAETGTGQSMYEIDRYVETNIGGTAKLLDILANGRHQVKKLVVASSRSIYGEGKYISKNLGVVYPGSRRESDMDAGRFEVTYPRSTLPLVVTATDEPSKLHPSSLYGITKQTQEYLVLTVAPTLGIAPVALRYQNVYGPGQSLTNPYTGILSIFSTLIREGREINIFEDGLESRDFVFIDDVIDATYSAIVSDRANGLAVNVGSGVPTTVREVVAGLSRVFGEKAQARVSGNYRLGDIRHNFADLKLARETLGFQPQVPFLEGLAKFASWVQQQPRVASKYETSLHEMRAKSLMK